MVVPKSSHDGFCSKKSSPKPRSTITISESASGQPPADLTSPHSQILIMESAFNHIQAHHQPFPQTVHQPWFMVDGFLVMVDGGPINHENTINHAYFRIWWHGWSGDSTMFHCCIANNASGHRSPPCRQATSLQSWAWPPLAVRRTAQQKEWPQVEVRQFMRNACC